MGPRKIPVFADFKQGKTVLPKQGDLKIVPSKKEIIFGADKPIDIGTNFIYVIE